MAPRPYACAVAPLIRIRQGVCATKREGGTPVKHIERALHKMEQEGLRITAQRKTMIAILAHSPNKMSPRDVYVQMTATYPGLSFDTVYRNLRILLDIGVIESFGYPDKIGYRLRCEQEEHHHHFICVQCEKTSSFSYCPMDVIRSLPQNYQIIRHIFEIQGLCDTCGEISGGIKDGDMEFERHTTTRAHL